MNLSCCLVHFIIAGVFVKAITDNGSEKQRLYAQRLTDIRSRNINKLVPPFSNSSFGLIGINIFFDLHRVISLSSDSATLSVSGVIIVSWTDKRYSWSSKDGPNSILYPAIDMWVPELLLSTSTDYDIRFGRTNDIEFVRLKPKGAATLEKTVQVAVACDIDVHYFPRDIQHCQLIFIPPNPFSDIMTITPKNMVMTNPLRPTMGDEWRLLACAHDYLPIDVARGDGTTRKVNSYQVHLLLHRNHAFYFLTIVLPAIMLGAVTLVPFLLPPSQCAQKLIIPVTTFLSFNIYMLLLEKSLPKSTSLPVLGKFYACLLAVATLTEILQAISVKFYSCHLKNIPKPLFLIYCRFLASICFFRSCHGIQHIRLDIDDIESDGQDNSKLIQKRWLTMGRVNDRVGLFFCFICILGAVTYFLVACYVDAVIPPQFRKYVQTLP